FVAGGYVPAVRAEQGSHDPFLMAAILPQAPAAHDLPDHDSSVLPAGDKSEAVRTERQGLDSPLVSVPLPSCLSRGRVPQTHLAGIPGRGQQSAVRAEGDLAGPLLWVDAERFPTRSDIPEVDGCVVNIIGRVDGNETPVG